MTPLEQRIDTWMGSFGYSFNRCYSTLYSTNAQVCAREIYRGLFDESYDNILKQFTKKKQRFCADVWGVNTCPFKELTGMSWEALYDHSYVFDPVLEKTPARYETYGIHSFVRSSFLRQGGPLETGYGILHVAIGSTLEETVVIKGTMYAYGESSLNIARDESTTEVVYPWTLRGAVPLIVVDDRIASLISQEESGIDVYRTLHALFLLSSHDILLHPLFAEYYPSFEQYAQEQVSIHRYFFENVYFGFSMFEYNFMRLMSDMFWYACKENPVLMDEFLGLYNRIVDYTESWNPIARDYIRHVAWNRQTRLVMNMHPGKILETKMKCFSKTGEDYRIYSTTSFPEHVIHSNPEWKGSLVYVKQKGWVRIPYNEMVQCTYDFYEHCGAYKIVQ